MAEVQDQNGRLREEVKNKEALIKNYNHNLHSKNVSLSNLEAKFQADIEALVCKKNGEIDELKLIIRAQEEEIGLLMGDQQMMVATFEELSEAERAKAQERLLLR